MSKSRQLGILVDFKSDLMVLSSILNSYYADGNEMKETRRIARFLEKGRYIVEKWNSWEYVYIQGKLSMHVDGRVRFQAPFTYVWKLKRSKKTTDPNF